MKRLQILAGSFTLLVFLALAPVSVFADGEDPPVPEVMDGDGVVVDVLDDPGQDTEYGDPDDAITGNRGNSATGGDVPLGFETEEEWLEYFLAWLQGLIIIP